MLRRRLLSAVYFWRRGFESPHDRVHLRAFSDSRVVKTTAIIAEDDGTSEDGRSAQTW